MKKLPIVSLLLALTVVVLAGCDQNSTSTSSTDTNSMPSTNMSTNMPSTNATH